MNPIIKKAITLVGTQMGLAKACGVTQSAVQKWLHGKANVAPKNVKSVVEATKGVIQGYEIRPDLPDLFPPPDKVA